jgi:exopolysaccharide production protein ExoZ
MKLHSLQALRAIAAWLVVADHALLDIVGNDPKNAVTHIAWTLGSTGVYVFFVISGFIMVHISWDTFGRSFASYDFLRRRVLRIVPLYWLATFVAIAYHRFSLTHGADAGLSELLRSLFFIPSVNAVGKLDFPIVPQGWTLTYEMMFYCLVAAAVSLRRSVALVVIAGGLLGFALSETLLAPGPLAYLASPIILWFVLGIAFAAIWRVGRFSEPLWLVRMSRLLEQFGDASYSTYLIHGLVLTLTLRIWLMLVGKASMLLLPIDLGMVTMAGLAAHLLIEKPMLRISTGKNALLLAPLNAFTIRRRSTNDHPIA